jgi:hypothetical protein
VPPATLVNSSQRLDRAERRGRRGDGPQPEGAEEKRPEPVQQRPGARGTRRQVRLVRPCQAPGLDDAACQPVPADRLGHRRLQVGLGVPGRDQRPAELGEEAYLVVDRAGIAQQGVLLAHLGAAEHAPDGAVEQADALVDQAGDRIEHGGDHRREKRRSGPDREPLGVHAIGTGRVEAEGAQSIEPFDQARQCTVTGRTGWLPGPGQHARRRALLPIEQRVECSRLRRGEAAGELEGDVTFGLQHHDADEALEHARAGRHDPPPAQLIHQRGRDRRCVRRGERHRQ